MSRRIAGRSGSFERTREQAACRTLKELIVLGELRGYKNPRYWADKILASRWNKEHNE